jgi:hypothetical protein
MKFLDFSTFVGHFCISRSGSETLNFSQADNASAYQDRRRCEGRQSRSAATPLPSPLVGWRRRTCGTGSCGTPPGPCLGVTKRGHLSWLTNGALVYEPKCGGGGDCRVLANEYVYSCAHGAQINFGDITLQSSKITGH